jgi:hypothetical protein
MPMWRFVVEDIIRDLLDALEAAEQQGAPLNDSVLRNAMQDVIHRGFVEWEPGYKVPADLLLNYTPPAAEQNAAVVKAFMAFIQRAREAAAGQGLESADDRHEAFFDSGASSTSGETSVDSFFE